MAARAGCSLRSCARCGYGARRPTWRADGRGRRLARAPPAPGRDLKVTRPRFWVAAGVTFLVLATLGVMVGAVSLAPRDVWHAIVGTAPPQMIAIVRML